MKRLVALIFSSLLAIASTTTAAATITFEGHPDDGASVQTQDGFTFTFNAAGWGIFTDGFVGGGAPYTQNGTTRLVASGDRNGTRASVTMTRTGGGTFSVQGFDAASMFPGLTDRMSILGNLSGGGTVSDLISVDDTFDSYALAGFAGLDSIVFSDALPGNFREHGFSIDNIIVDGATVPEPGSLALFGFAVAGMAATRSRRRR